MPLRSTAALLTLTACTLLLVGCSNDSASPDIGYGAIEGTVTEAGAPYTDILVKISEFGAPHGTRAWTRPDSSGHYRIEVANGLYLFTTTPPSSDVTSFSMSDSVRVASNVVPLDFTFGRADITLDLPPETEGRNAIVRMAGPGSAADHVPVVNGKAALTLHELEPGAYTVQVEAGTLPLTLPTMLEVGTDAPAGLGVDLTGSYAALDGVVTGAWQTWDQSPPWIRVLAPDSTLLGSITPWGDGSFAVEVFKETTFVLQVAPFDGLDFLVGGATMAEATRFTLKPGDHLTGVEIPEARIRVHLNGPDGMIDHRASVLLIDPRGERHHLFLLGDPQPLTIPGLAPGRYFLQVHGYNTNQTWAAQWYDGADSLAAATPIDVTAGQAVDLSLDLVPGGSISGQVLIDGSVPLADIACALYDAQGLPLARDENHNWKDFPAGACTFVGLPDGPFYLAARLGTGPVWYPGTQDFAQAEPVVIRDHGAVTGLTWDLFPAAKAGP